MQEQLRCELISWAEVERLCQRLGGLIRDSGYRPDLVIAIGRGGYVPARLLCDYMHIMGLTSIKIEHYLSGANRQEEAVIRHPLKADIRGLRVLVVDDVNDTGDTLEAAMQHLQTFQPGEIRTAVMHHKVLTHFEEDYSAEKIIKWRWLIYPWAVNEDVSDFLKRLIPAPGSLEDAQIRLAQRFNIKISLKRLRGIYASMNRQPEFISR
jgi:hypoxanthine phosphoribosyltransferase